MKGICERFQVKLHDLERQVIARIGLVTLFVFAISGCATAPEDEQVVPTPTEAQVEILYATDRNVTGQTDPHYFYGVERAPVSYGTATVSIRIEKSISPYADQSRWNLEYGGKVKKRGELTKIEPLPKQDFFRYLSNRLQYVNDKSALVYIHGYKRTFDTAVIMTAMMAYETDYQGVPILYSWPSRGSFPAYVGDVTAIDWSVAHLQTFLEEVVSKTNAETVHLVAHSLGNRALLKTLVALLKKPDITDNWKFGEIILVAPDVDRDVFERDIAPVITQAKSRITLYVSSVDIPLQASKTLNIYPRVGDANDDPVIIEGIETIDASEAANLITGHTYYRDTPEVLADLYYLVNKRQAASERPTLEAVETSGGHYWKIQEVEIKP